MRKDGVSIVHTYPCPAASSPTRALPDGARPDRGGGDGLRRSAAVVIAVVLQRLVEDATRIWTVEERLVLDALRRSAGHLNEASVEELSAYVAALSPDQLRGVASNIKGIYHELLYVHAENHDGDQVAARVFEATNHPGADVEFIVDGETIREVQLKAVASAAAIREHLARYPEIDVIATTEVAEHFPGLATSGLSNDDLSRRVDDVISELPGDTLAEDIAEGASASALVAGAAIAGAALRGGMSKPRAAAALGDVSIGVVTATVLDTLLDGFF